eukprot:149592_1
MTAMMNEIKERKKKTSISIPSISTANNNDTTTDDEDDEDGNDESDESDDEHNNDTSSYNQPITQKAQKGKFRILSTKTKTKKSPQVTSIMAKKMTFSIPSLSTAMSKSSTIYDRNTNIKPKSSVPSFNRPNSAKFGENKRSHQASNSAPVSPLRPSSARAATNNRKMTFMDDEDEDEDGPMTPTDSDYYVDSDGLTPKGYDDDDDDDYSSGSDSNSDSDSDDYDDMTDDDDD